MKRTSSSINPLANSAVDWVGSLAARVEREETKAVGVQPSLEPTVLK